MQSPQWPAFETAIYDYMKEQFHDSSLKRQNEFETLWNVAFTEGGKYHLNQFINKLNEHASYD